MLSEKQIIKGCRQGEKASQYELVKRYSAMLMAVCRRYARDEASAKDILQETFIRIFRNIEKYKAIGSFEGWMKKIAVRCALTWLKKSHLKKETEFTDFVFEKKITPEVYDYLGVEEITKLVKELPQGYRVVFNLNVVEGFSHKEISEILGISESASRSQLVRARRMLQNKIEATKIINVKKYKSA